MKAKIKSKLDLENRVPLQDVIPLETPFLIYLDPSSLCNFHCQFCPSGHKDLIKQAGYKRNIMDLELFYDFIDKLKEFSKPIKVLRMNKIGEPFLNKNLEEMIRYAKKSGRVEYVDFATNAALLTKERSLNIIEAGVDRINISIEGVNKEQYAKYCRVDIDFDSLIESVKFLYENKKNCEITIKIPGNYLNEEDKQRFFEIFGNYCDRIFIENLTSIWPAFDIQEYSDIKISNESQYKQEQEDKDICSYIFYSAVINADGTVSACCPDWEQKLIVGDLNTQSLKEIWTSPEFNNLRLQHLEGKRCQNKTCGACGHIKYCQVDNIDPHRDLILNKLK